jgi:predicted nucleic acid-binding protein
MPKHQSLSHKQMAANDEVKQAVVQAVAVESVERIVNAPVMEEIYTRAAAKLADDFDKEVLDMMSTEAIVLETPVKPTKKKSKNTKTTNKE